jgi:hypothetical protein
MTRAAGLSFSPPFTSATSTRRKDLFDAASLRLSSLPSVDNCRRMSSFLIKFRYHFGMGLVPWYFDPLPKLYAVGALAIARSVPLRHTPIGRTGPSGRQTQKSRVLAC